MSDGSKRDQDAVSYGHWCFPPPLATGASEKSDPFHPSAPTMPSWPPEVDPNCTILVLANLPGGSSSIMSGYKRGFTGQRFAACQFLVCGVIVTKCPDRVEEGAHGGPRGKGHGPEGLHREPEVRSMPPPQRKTLTQNFSLADNFPLQCPILE